MYVSFIRRYIEYKKQVLFPLSSELIGSREELEQQTSVNAKDSYSNTVLHYAARDRQWEVVKWLIEKRAQVNAYDTDSMTALHYAARAAQWEVVKWLIENKANVNASDKDGRTVLHYAVQANAGLEIVKWLIEK